jgi:hypothetical protein
MGYYDFNDHFWSPQEVCAQLPSKQVHQQTWGFQKLAAFIAVCTRMRYTDSGVRAPLRVPLHKRRQKAVPH